MSRSHTHAGGEPASREAPGRTVHLRSAGRERGRSEAPTEPAAAAAEGTITVEPDPALGTSEPTVAPGGRIGPMPGGGRATCPADVGLEDWPCLDGRPIHTFPEEELAQRLLDIIFKALDQQGKGRLHEQELWPFFCAYDQDAKREEWPIQFGRLCDEVHANPRAGFAINHFMNLAYPTKKWPSILQPAPGSRWLAWFLTVHAVEGQSVVVRPGSAPIASEKDTLWPIACFAPPAAPSDALPPGFPRRPPGCPAMMPPASDPSAAPQATSKARPYSPPPGLTQPPGGRPALPPGPLAAEYASNAMAPAPLMLDAHGMPVQPMGGPWGGQPGHTFHLHIYGSDTRALEFISRIMGGMGPTLRR